VYLQDSMLRDLIAKRALVVEPYEPRHVGPDGIDLTVGPVCWRWQTEPGMVTAFTPKVLGQITEADMVREGYGPGEVIVLAPQEMVILSTAEWVEIPTDLVGFLSNKSTTARSGVFMHLGAGHIDAGFKGRITMEALNTSPFPIKVPVGVRAATLLLARLMGPAERPYGSEGLGSRYHLQTEAQPARPERSYWDIPGRKV